MFEVFTGISQVSCLQELHKFQKPTELFAALLLLQTFLTSHNKCLGMGRGFHLNQNSMGCKYFEQTAFVMLKKICGLKASKQENATFSSSYQCKQPGYSKLKRSNQYIQSSRIIKYLPQKKVIQLFIFYRKFARDQSLQRRAPPGLTWSRGSWEIPGYCLPCPASLSLPGEDDRKTKTFILMMMIFQISGPSGATRPELRAQLLRGVQVQILALRRLGRGEMNSQLSFCKKSAGLEKACCCHQKINICFQVLVDDRLPTYKGRLVYLHSTDPAEFWAALLEKAYAKVTLHLLSIYFRHLTMCFQLYGCYEALHSGFTTKALQDLTGGIVQSFSLTSQDRMLTYQVNINITPQNILKKKYIFLDTLTSKVPQRERDNLNLQICCCQGC